MKRLLENKVGYLKLFMMKFSTVAVSILILSTVLQLVCLVSPGWLILIFGDTTIYMATFYITRCTKVANVSRCITQSWADYFKPIAADSWYDPKYGQVQVQVFFTLVFVATCLTLGMHVVKRMRPAAMSYMAFIISTCSCMLGSGVCMILYLSSYVVLNSTYQEHEPTNVVDFPYCVLLYGLAFLANIAVFVMFVVDVMRYYRRQINREQKLYAGRQCDTDCQLLLETARDPYDADTCV